jgi:ADP-ribose pyrophosphatase YjhB (NUDIX family)
MSKMPTDYKATGPTQIIVPEGDNRERLVCKDCGFINYQNPIIVVGTVTRWSEKKEEDGEQILLCKRAIEPRKGFWTLPAGYLELEETTEEGAIRETWEEARAKVSIDRLMAVYNISRLSQVQLIYQATLLSPNITAGEESLEVGLFSWKEIPWDEIAFPTVHWALHQNRSVLGQESFKLFGNPENESADKI